MVVAAYDISNDRRRTKLHKRLLDYGTPLQYSLFECLLDGERMDQMKRAVRKSIRPRLDQVRYWYLCQSCLEKVDVTSGPEVLSEVVVIIV